MNRRYIGIFAVVIVSLVGLIIYLTFNNSFIGLSSDNFDGYFLEALVDDIDVSTSIISDNRKEVNFKTKKLLKGGDKSVLKYKVKNNSQEYDIDIALMCDVPSTDTYTIQNNRDDLVRSNSELTGEVIVSLTESLDKEVDFNCKLNLKAPTRGA